MAASPKCAGRCGRVVGFTDPAQQYCDTCYHDRQCHHDGCTAGKNPDEGACASHMCDASKCTAEQVYGGSYCGRHTCGNRPCRAQAVKDGYCDEHGQHNRNQGGRSAPAISDLRRRRGSRDAI